MDNNNSKLAAIGVGVVFVHEVDEVRLDRVSSGVNISRTGNNIKVIGFRDGRSRLPEESSVLASLDFEHGSVSFASGITSDYPSGVQKLYRDEPNVTNGHPYSLVSSLGEYIKEIQDKVLAANEDHAAGRLTNEEDIYFYMS
jgi:hypothetical protein